MSIFGSMIRLLLFFFAFSNLSYLEAQKYTSIAPWDNALSYHPVIVGVDTDEAIQMNIFSQQTPETFAIPLGFTLRNVIDFNRVLLEPIDIKNSYFFGYQKTIEFKRQQRLTGGLQLQHYNELRRLVQDNTIAGFTINYHKPLAKKKHKTKYLSFGYQINLIFHTPNRSVTSFGYSTLTTPNLSFDEFNAQFRNTGFNQTIGVNYSYLREHKTSFNLGLSLSVNNISVATQILSTTEGVVRFRNDGIVQARFNLDIQQVLGKKFVLQLNLLEQFNSQLGFGFGFKLGKYSIFKVIAVQNFIDYVSVFDGISSYSGINLSLDMKRYKYIASLGLKNINFAKFGVVYRLEQRDTRSMLSPSQ